MLPRCVTDPAPHIYVVLIVQQITQQTNGRAPVLRPGASCLIYSSVHGKLSPLSGTVKRNVEPWPDSGPISHHGFSLFYSDASSASSSVSNLSAMAVLRT
jgi:hypothetical protein